MLMREQCFDPSEVRSKAHLTAGFEKSAAPSSTQLSIFLSHAHQDQELAAGIAGMLGELGVAVYIDWQDGEMPSQPTRQTANRIKRKIRDLDWFLFLETKNSKSSRWCPWEIGYADGVKDIDRIVMVPFFDEDGSHGNEYLDLYRRIDPADLTQEAQTKTASARARRMGESNKEQGFDALNAIIREPGS